MCWWILLCVLADLVQLVVASDNKWDNNVRSDCKADTGGSPDRRLQAEETQLGWNATFLPALDGPAANPPPMSNDKIYKGVKCDKDTYRGFWDGSCRWFDCKPERFSYCDEDSDHLLMSTYHCKCPDGSCAVPEDPDKPNMLTCQIHRVKKECPPGSGIFWQMEHIEVEYEEEDDSCTFTKTTGIDDMWDAVAWSENANLRDITWHSIGKPADRNFGYSNDPIADSVDAPIANGVAVAMDKLNHVQPPTDMAVKHGGHVSTVRMEIVNKTNTYFEFEGEKWGWDHGNKNVAHHMHAHMWIKQRCGKLKVTGIRVLVPCELGDWTPWGECSKSCSPGVQDRTRKIRQEGTYEQACKGTRDPTGKLIIDHQTCDHGCCPVNCELSQWSQWGECSQTCGAGEAVRTRTITKEASCHGTCGDLAQHQVCNDVCCPVNCELGPWSKWGECSVSCGGGEAVRTRSINQEPSCNGTMCTDELAQHEVCNDVCCPMNCELSEWSKWGECSVSCGGGEAVRTRSVTQEPSCNGTCMDDLAEHEVCNEDCCPKDCELSDWSRWGECSVSCGGGEAVRTRSITQKPSCNGTCTDDFAEHEVCNEDCCPMDCELSEWSEWEECSVSCGGGEAVRTRSITQQPSCNGTCTDDLAEHKVCNEDCCPMDCELSEWSEWGDCSVSCGGGEAIRTRTITQEPSCNGTRCEAIEDKDYCNFWDCGLQHCEWTEWTAWSACNETCNGGVRTRSRQVEQEAKNGGDGCDDCSEETQECHMQSCNDHWTAGKGAEIAPDGITFIGDDADAVVSSQSGVVSISVRNKNVKGLARIGLAQDASPNFDAGKGIVLPYKDAEEDDILTIGLQAGHAKLFVNNHPKPVKDLGVVGDNLMAKVILDQGTSVRIDAIIFKPTSWVLLANFGSIATSVPSWVLLAAMTAASLGVMAAMARQRSRRVAEVQQPLLEVQQ